MKSLLPYITIARPGNALMTGIAVLLGYWLGDGSIPLPGLLLIVIAGMCATAYGNVINDLKDIATDCISHPDRPLPRNDLSRAAAYGYLAYLAIIALGASLLVSGTHAIATLIPLALLTVYTLYLKGTPLAGNVLVSLLVGYALLFGGLTAPRFERLLLPAALAFLLNLIREIIKDMQDEPGDRAAGIVTSASLPRSLVRVILLVLCCLYPATVFLPTVFGQFGTVYVVVCAGVIVPLHLVWVVSFLKAGWTARLPLLSRLIKIEMLAGLIALALDELFALIAAR